MRGRRGVTILEFVDVKLEESWPSQVSYEEGMKNTNYTSGYNRNKTERFRKI